MRIQIGDDKEFSEDDNDVLLQFLEIDRKQHLLKQTPDDIR